MYFEAVQEILSKLGDSKIKSGNRQRLLKELSEIDPDGAIQNYVKNGGTRPDISNLMKK